MRLEREAVGVTFDAQARTQLVQCGGQPTKVVGVACRAHINVDGCVTRLVQSGGDATDDDELDAVFCKDAADHGDVVVVELRRRH